MSDDASSIAEVLADLRGRHRELDESIRQFSAAPTSDQLQLTRMKRQKLRIKDQIAWYESKLIPDLDA